MTMTLATLTARTGLTVLDHIERELTIPVAGQLQAQGDLIIIPSSDVPHAVIMPRAYWRDVPATGIEILRAASGGNPHTLVADPGTCQWTTGIRDRTGLAIGALTTTTTVYLLHPEHGASGIAPGTYIIRRQRERTASPRPDRPYQLIAD